MSLLTVSHLSKTFTVEKGLLGKTTARVAALQDVSLTIERGESVAIVGGSGCGKTTLAKILCGLIDPDQGTVSWEKQPLSSFSRLGRAGMIQMVFQDPFASLNPKLSIETQLMEVAESRNAVLTLLKQVGMGPDALGCYPFQFSGGQRQRLAIARALARRPQLLIADEPLSALDVTLQAQMVALLKRLKEEHDLTVLLITHDFAVVDAFAQRAIVMQNGQIVEESPTPALLSKPRHAYTQALLSAVPKLVL